ncbi:MAG: NRDE family protein [Pseudohongiellaceae bacterium]
MCTLTIIPDQHGLIVTMNRDEQRSRGEIGTLLTGRSDITGVSYCYPLDALHGGTWFGCNSAGIVLALLNRYQEESAQPVESRGMIIPALISCGSIPEMLRTLRDREEQRCNPHDLILMDTKSMVRCTWDGRHYQISERDTKSGVMVSSSSMLPEHTIEYREALFRKWQEEYEEVPMKWARILTDFHLQKNDADPSASVLMSRPQSHTKSISQARLESREIEMFYIDEATLRELTPGIVPQARSTCRFTVNSPVAN